MNWEICITACKLCSPFNAVISNKPKCRGNLKKAESFLTQGLTIREALLSKLHPSVAESLQALAYLYGTKGEYQKAIDNYKKALNIIENIFDANRKTTTGIPIVTFF